VDGFLNGGFQRMLAWQVGLLSLLRPVVPFSWDVDFSGSQDFYPTFLKNQVLMGPTDVTVISVVGQIGALIGGTTLGYISTFLGKASPSVLYSAAENTC
jgi:hypothetical protein